ncbi:MAG: acetyl-CoA carboxylase biotin carboxyl carrier protein subunit [Bacteroides sp.]|nr:acetyl-CoA carboxylase biotin carboxyl carrier protein subunit [Bacteroides sp.]MBD5337017.1 acetyl-CoA carboxylase biotin carboxyl carrier protein subunit [Bacteroides sp.]
MSLKEYKYKINGIKFNVGVGDVVDNTVQVMVNGTPYTVELDKAPAQKTAVSAPAKPAAAAPRTESGEKVIAKPVASSSAGAVKSPLPGTIMSISVKVGDTVSAGATVCVLEAMKMENDVHSDKSGTVKSILVNPGDTVLEGTDLMIIE